MGRNPPPGREQGTLGRVSSGVCGRESVMRPNVPRPTAWARTRAFGRVFTCRLRVIVGHASMMPNGSRPTSWARPRRAWTRRGGSRGQHSHSPSNATSSRSLMKPAAAVASSGKSEGGAVESASQGRRPQNASPGRGPSRGRSRRPSNSSSSGSR